MAGDDVLLVDRPQLVPGERVAPVLVFVGQHVDVMMFRVVQLRPARRR